MEVLEIVFARVVPLHLTSPTQIIDVPLNEWFTEKPMKKVFKLTDPRKAPARQVDSVKHEIKKYLARERRKTLKEGADYWDFDCRIGRDLESAATISVGDINKGIDSIVLSGADQFYIEVLAKPGFKR